MLSIRTAILRYVIVVSVLTLLPIQSASAQPNGGPFQEIGAVVNDLEPRVEALEESVGDLDDDVTNLAERTAELEDKTTLSDLECQSFPTIPGPLAIRRGGQWQCADLQFVREKRDLPAGTRDVSISATCPAGTVPMIGGTGGTRFSPPDPGNLVLANSGPGPSFDQWSANWVSIQPQGTVFETTLSVVVFCLKSG